MKEKIKYVQLELSLFEIEGKKEPASEPKKPVKIYPPVCQYCGWDEPNKNCIYCRKVKRH